MASSIPLLSTQPLASQLPLNHFEVDSGEAAQLSFPLEDNSPSSALIQKAVATKRSILEESTANPFKKTKLSCNLPEEDDDEIETPQSSSSFRKLQTSDSFSIKNQTWTLIETELLKKTLCEALDLGDIDLKTKRLPSKKWRWVEVEVNYNKSILELNINEGKHFQQRNAKELSKYYRFNIIKENESVQKTDFHKIVEKMREVFKDLNKYSVKEVCVRLEKIEKIFYTTQQISNLITATKTKLVKRGDPNPSMENILTKLLEKADDDLYFQVSSAIASSTSLTRHEIKPLPQPIEPLQRSTHIPNTAPADGLPGDFGLLLSEDLPLLEGDFSLPEGDFSLPEGDFPLPEGDFSLPEGDFPLLEGDFSLPEGNFPPPKDDFL